MPDAPSRQGMVDRVLGYLAGISTWKQAFITIALGAAILGGVMLYEHPEWIERWWRTKHTAAATMADEKRIKGGIEQLRLALGARFVAVAQANAAKNLARVVAVAAEPGYEATANQLREGRWAAPVALFTDDPVANITMVKVIEGEVPCAREVMAAPVRKVFEKPYSCTAGIPPSNDDFLGFVVAGFAENLDAGEEYRVRAALRAKVDEWTEWHD